MHIIITGASRGLGFATAFRLAAQLGHQVVAISRNAEGLSRLQESCLRTNPASVLHPLPMDLEQVLEDPGPVLAAIRPLCPSLDILIHNAGMLLNQPFSETSYPDSLALFRTNFFLPAQLTRALLPLMKESHVLSITSMGGYAGSVKFPGLSYYSASKGALGILTECLAEEYKEKNIRFNALALGSVQTEMLEQAFPGYQAPLSAEEMAAFVADFALNGNRFFNGKILPVAVTTP